MSASCFSSEISSSILKLMAIGANLLCIPKGHTAGRLQPEGTTKRASTHKVYIAHLQKLQVSRLLTLKLWNCCELFGLERQSECLMYKEVPWCSPAAVPLWGSRPVHNKLAPIGHRCFTSKNDACVIFPIQNKPAILTLMALTVHDKSARNSLVVFYCNQSK